MCLVTLTVTTKPLGIAFSGHPGENFLSVMKFNRAGDGSMRQPEASGKVHVGDQLVVVGDKEVQGLQIGDVVKLLKISALPLRLQFIRVIKHRATVSLFARSR